MEVTPNKSTYTVTGKESFLGCAKVVFEEIIRVSDLT